LIKHHDQFSQLLGSLEHHDRYEGHLHNDGRNDNFEIKFSFLRGGKAESFVDVSLGHVIDTHVTGANVREQCVIDLRRVGKDKQQACGTDREL
jgi:hypothetical protein